LASIGNPAPMTANGHAVDGKCRPKFSLAMNILQSSSKAVKIHDSSLFATTAKQGAGLVNAFQALTATTIFSPSELGLNDTVRKASSYKVKVINIGNKRAVYKMSHHGAALATGKTEDDDQLLPNPLFSANYAVSFASETDIG
jgi:minor extracellular serine protease Vpr